MDLHGGPCKTPKDPIPPTMLYPFRRSMLTTGKLGAYQSNVRGLGFKA